MPLARLWRLWASRELRASKELYGHLSRRNCLFTSKDFGCELCELFVLVYEGMTRTDIDDISKFALLVISSEAPGFGGGGFGPVPGELQTACAERQDG